jgi:hypothetical protein
MVAMGRRVQSDRDGKDRVIHVCSSASVLPLRTSSVAAKTERRRAEAWHGWGLACVPQSASYS